MDTKSRGSKRRDATLSTLNAAIEAMNLAKEVSGATPAKAIFGSVGVILAMIRVGSLLVHFGEPQANEYTGFDDEQNRLRRARTGLRRCV